MDEFAGLGEISVQVIIYAVIYCTHLKKRLWHCLVVPGYWMVT